MLGTKRAGEAGLLFIAFQLDHGGEQGPDEAIANADKAIAACNAGFKRKPGFGNIAVNRGGLFVIDLPMAGFSTSKAMVQHIADLIAPFHGFDIPCEGNQIPPITIFCKEVNRGVNIALGERFTK